MVKRFDGNVVNIKFFQNFQPTSYPNGFEITKFISIHKKILPIPIMLMILHDENIITIFSFKDA